MKSGIINVFSHHYAKFKVDLYDSLPIEKILTFHNFIKFNKLVLKQR